MSGTQRVEGGKAPNRLRHDVVAGVPKTGQFPTLSRRGFLVLGGGGGRRAGSSSQRRCLHCSTTKSVPSSWLMSMHTACTATIDICCWRRSRARSSLRSATSHRDCSSASSGGQMRTQRGRRTATVASSLAPSRRLRSAPRPSTRPRWHHGTRSDRPGSNAPPATTSTPVVKCLGVVRSRHDALIAAYQLHHIATLVTALCHR